MSTYLFTFVIGNYDLIETVNENKTKIRVFTPLRDHHDGALCMNLAQYSLRFYQKFFEINYYYEKLDFVPIPEMNFRAMENLGCIVFKNEAMLFSHFQSIFEKNLHQELYLMKYPICGLVIWSQWNGGMIFGLMKVLQEFLNFYV